MDAEEFWKRVSVRSGIHGRGHVVAATECVFEALRARMSHQTGDNIAQQLPSEVKRLWESGPREHQEREAAEVERMDLNEFLERIQSNKALTGSGNAGEVARAVFMTMQEQITPGASQKVTSELPGDIRQFWLDSMPEERPIESPASQRDRTGEARDRKEPPALAEQFEKSDEPDIPAASRMTRQGSPRGEYTSKEIGPSSASVFRSDDQIRAEINHLLEASDEVDPSGIDVEVRAGRVTLQGRVHSILERDAVRRIARDALGVVEVDNRLRLERRR